MYKRAFIFTVALVLWLSIGVNFLKTKAETVPTPQELLQLITRRFETLKDYQCQLTTTHLKNGQTVTDINNYYFKKPKLIRLEVMNGKDKGSKVVLNKNGKVRARAGGVLGVFTITMEPNDKRLQDDDGSSFATTDLGSTIKDIRATLAGGTATVTIVERGKRTYQLQIDRPGKRDLIVIDAQLQLPIEWYTFSNGRFDSKTEWKNLQMDVGFSDSLFEM